MPTWTTPPTFSYGYPASVDDMNVIRNDILYLYGEMFNVSNATLESEVHCNSPFDYPAGVLAGILWIEHHADNLYYRIRILGQIDGMEVTLHIKYFESPYEAADEMGEHTEGPITVGTDYVLFTNSDAAVDISGWGLTANEMYKVEVTVTETEQDNKDVWVEIQFMYEQG